MKAKWFFSVLFLLLTACSVDKNRSDAYGNFEAREVIISSEAQGRILKFIIEEGEELQAGVNIGLIDTVDLSLRRDQLYVSRNAVISKIRITEAQIDIQKQQKENILVEKRRIENLLKDGAATTKQLDDINGSLSLVDKQTNLLHTQITGIRDEAATIEAQIAQVNENIRKCYLVNPMRGTVLTKYVECNEIATIGKPLYKIANLDTLELRVYISGAQLPHVNLGNSVDVLVDKNEKSNQKLNGTVSWISQQAEFTPKIIQTKEERVKLVYAVKILVQNDGTLKIGMPGEINF
ncbi:MAG: HlyD family efflux transporter periplasmic adaptor subunit [Bacteroidetes bacterium]|nr:HlyD family efflux transporter periplasmic adaptor subunit [Bacteroidota bacterium]